MTRSQKRPSPLRILFTLLFLVLVAAGVFAGSLYLSAKKIETHIAGATESYEQCLSQLEQQQFDDALVSIRTTSEEIAIINQGLGGVQWDLAEKLPYLSDDVTCARQSAGIADDLSNGALIPVIEQATQLMGDIDSSDPLTGFGNALSKLPDFYNTLASARKIVGSCKTQADTLPESHFESINEWADTVQTAATSAEEAFAQLDVIFGAVDTLTGLADSLTAPANPTTSA